MEDEWRERRREGIEGERDLKLQKLHVRCRVCGFLKSKSGFTADGGLQMYNG